MPDAAASKGDPTVSQRITAQIAELNDWRGKMLADLRALILAAGPDITEESLLLHHEGDGAPRVVIVDDQCASRRTDGEVYRVATNHTPTKQYEYESQPSRLVRTLCSRHGASQSLLPKDI